MKPFVFIILSTLILSCTQTTQVQYKYGDKEQSIACANQNNELLNEALYSFEEDILQFNPSPTKTRIAAYGQFMYKGMAGTAVYKDIVTNHSLALRDQLLGEGILIPNGKKSNLNYEHPAVQCIISNIEDPRLKKTINSLLEAKSMDPSLFNSRLRNFGSLAKRNRYEATYIALDSYYQNLVGLSLDTKTTNE